MEMVRGKSPGESAIETRYLVMPDQVNHYGTAFGGVILSWIDMAAAMVAERHCEGEAVTVSIDKVSFLAPINIGDHVVLKAIVTYTGNTSLEIEVQVTKENPYSGEKVQATKAFLTFVALDSQKRPTKVPDLILETEAEKQRFQEAKLRVESRRKSC
jgi:acyl-CoA hydrolase